MDAPTWTITVTANESRMLLRALLATIPGMAAGELRTYSESVRNALQDGHTSFSGLNVELLDVADTAQTYYGYEAQQEGTALARKQAKAALDWAGKVYAKVLTKADGVRKFAEPKPVKDPKRAKPVPVTKSLFGDDD